MYICAYVSYEQLLVQTKEALINFMIKITSLTCLLGYLENYSAEHVITIEYLDNRQ